jgi:hypothetical protein
MSLCLRIMLYGCVYHFFVAPCRVPVPVPGSMTSSFEIIVSVVVVICKAEVGSQV